MFLSIISGLQHWFGQIQSLVRFRFNHLSPNDYTVMLVLCICIGYCLLRGRN